MSPEPNKIQTSASHLSQAVPQPIELQINAITASIEQLNQSVGEMRLGIEQICREQSLQSQSSSRLAGVADSYAEFTSPRSSYLSDGERYHKDILEDVEGWSSQDNTEEGRHLSPEIQIQRLTAQLTAAYSRIAALEEQLLARRMH